MPMSAPETTVAMSLSFSVGTPEASAAISSSRMVAKPKPRRERSISRAVVSATIDQEQHQHEQILDIGAEHRDILRRNDIGAARAADEGPVDDKRLQHHRQRQRGDGEEHAAQPQRQVAHAEPDQPGDGAADDDEKW